MGRRSFDFVWGVALGALAAGAVMWAMGSGVPKPAPDWAGQPAGISASASAAQRVPGGPAGSAAAVDGPAAAGSTLTDTALGAELAAVRDAMARRAWQRPKRDNVTERLEQLAERWPDDDRVAAVRREAAERLLADALALKYANRVEAASQRVRLALKWAPDLPGAQPFLDELQAPASSSADPLDFGIAPAPTRVPETGLAGDSTRSPLAPPPGKGNPEP